MKYFRLTILILLLSSFAVTFAEGILSAQSAKPISSTFISAISQAKHEAPSDGNLGMVGHCDFGFCHSAGSHVGHCAVPLTQFQFQCLPVLSLLIQNQRLTYLDHPALDGLRRPPRV